ncbi:PH domain-containing protein [Lapillicoccus sp.]|uniref:PH domain-containing protein n=1 Tax=Lapillicoccus sp. TaxID=1909287 RepID=UPI0032669072
MVSEGDPTGGVVELREPANLVSPRARLMWLLEGVVQMVVLLAGQVVWWLIDQDGPRTPHVVVAAVWFVLAAAYLVVMPQWRYRVHRWENTETAVYTQTGWLSQERRIAPVSRIQTVDLARGPVAQLLGLASVTVTTASAAGPLKIHGLDLAVARHLVNDLTERTIAEPGDAT